ncbi:MAG: inverse autotransporter beta domain-containing protein [Pseudomonadota bacterium]
MTALTMLLTSGTLAWAGPLKNPYTPDEDDWSDARDTPAARKNQPAGATLERIPATTLSVTIDRDSGTETGITSFGGAAPGATAPAQPSTRAPAPAPASAQVSAGAGSTASGQPVSQVASGATAAISLADRVQPRISLQLEAGNDRGIGTADVFLPFFQDERSVAFFDLRGVATTQEEFEGNVGVGYRRAVGDLFGEEVVLGAYAFFDLRESENDNQYYQGTFGAEFLTDTFEARINGYLPNSDRNVIVPGGSGIGVFGTTVQQFSLVGLVEQALPGVEAEVGVNLDLSDDVRFSATGGYFHFERDSTQVAGPKGRLELQWSDPFDIDGALLSVGGEIKNDRVRDTQATGFIRFSIPLSANPTPQRDLSARARKLGSYVYRDVDIVAPVVFDNGFAGPNVDVTGGPLAPNSAAGSPSADGETINIFHVADAPVGTGDCSSAANACAFTTVETDPAFGAGDVIVVVDSAGATITSDFLLTGDLQRVLGAGPNGTLTVTLPDANNSQVNLSNLGGRVGIQGTVSPENGSTLERFDLNGGTGPAILVDNDIGVGTAQVIDVPIWGGSEGFYANNSASGGIAFDTASSITGVSGTSVRVEAPTLEATFNAPITHTGAGAAVEVTGHNAGQITFNAPITSTSGDGVAITATGPGSQIAFGADLMLSSPTGTAFQAMDVFGSLSVSNAPTVTLETTSGQALSLTNVTIGGGGFYTDTIIASGGSTSVPVSINGASGGDVFLGLIDVDGTAGANVDALYIAETSNTITATSIIADNISGDAIEIAGTNSLVSLGFVDADSVAGIALNIDSLTGTVDVGGGAIGGTTTNGQTARINALTSGSQVNLNNLTLSADDALGVEIIDSAGTVSLTGGGITQAGSGPALSISGGAGTLLASGTTDVLNTNPTSGQGVVIDGLSGGLIDIDGNVSVAGAGEIVQIGAANSLTGGTVNFDGDVVADGGASVDVFGVGSGVSVAFNGSTSVTGNTGPAIDIAFLDGDVSFADVDITNPGTAGVRVANTIAGTLSFDDLDIALETDGSVGVHLSSSTITGSVTATDFDLTSTSTVNTIGISIEGTTGTGTVRFGDTDPSGQSASIAGTAIGVQVSSTTNIGMFVFGDGEDGTDQGSTIEATIAINSADLLLPTLGSYDFLDVDFATPPSAATLTVNLQGIDIFYVDQDGTADVNSPFAAGSVFNPGSIAQANAATGIDVIALIDTNVDGNADTIDAGAASQGSGTSLSLDDEQILISFGTGGGSIDLSDFGLVATSIQPPFKFSGLSPSLTVAEPSNIDVAPILTTTSGTATEVVTIVGSAGIANTTITASGVDGVSGTSFADTEVVRLRDVSISVTGGTALDLADNGQDLSVQLNSVTLTGDTPLDIDGSGGGTLTANEFNDISLDGGVSTLTGMVFDGTTGGTVQTVTGGTLSATGGVLFDSVTGSLAFDSVDITATGATALSVTGTQDFSLNTSGGTITATNGTAIDIDGAHLFVLLDRVSSSNGTGIAVSGARGIISANQVDIASGDNTGITVSGDSSFGLGISGGTVTANDATAIDLSGIDVDITLDQVNASNTGRTSIDLDNLGGSVSILGGTISSTVTGTFNLVDIVQNDAGSARDLTVNLANLTIAEATGDLGGTNFGISANVFGDDRLAIGVSGTTITGVDAGVLFLNTSTSRDGLTVTDFSNNTFLAFDPSPLAPTSVQFGAIFDGVTFDADTATAGFQKVSGGTLTFGSSTAVTRQGLILTAGVFTTAPGGSQGTFEIADLQAQSDGFLAQIAAGSDLTLNVLGGDVAGANFTINDATVDITLNTATLTGSTSFTDVSGVVNVQDGVIDDLRVFGGDAAYTIGADIGNGTTGSLSIAALTGGSVTVRGDTDLTSSLQIANINSGNPVTINLTGAITLSGAGIRINDTPDADITISGNTTIIAPGTNAIRFDNPGGTVTISGDLSVSGATGTNPVILFEGAQGSVSITGATSLAALDGDAIGFNTAETVTGDIVFSDLDIELQSDNATGLDFANVTLDGNFSADDIDIVGGSLLTGVTGVDLAGATTNTMGQIRLGDTDVAGADATIGGSVNIGVNFSATTAINFVFGDGEDTTDQGSIINATIQINAPNAPTNGSYNFQDVNFTATQPGGAGSPRPENVVFPIGLDVVFVAASATGDGSGRDVDNRATVVTADAITRSGVTFVLINDGNAINDVDGFTLDLGQSIDGFGNANQIAAGLQVPSSFSGIPGASGTISDPTGNGAATLTSLSGGNPVVTVAGDNTIANVIISANGSIGIAAGASTAPVVLGSAEGSLIVRQDGPQFLSPGVDLQSTTVAGPNVTFKDAVISGFYANVWVSGSGQFDVDKLEIDGGLFGMLFSGNFGTRNVATDVGDMLVIKNATVNATAQLGTGQLNFGAGTTLSEAINIDLFINNNNGPVGVNFAGTIKQTGLNAGEDRAVFIGTGFGVANAGTITFTPTSIISTDGAGVIEVSDTTGTVTFSGKIDAKNGTSNGIRLFNNSGTVTFDGTTDVLGASNAGIVLDNNSGPVTFGANTTITDSASQAALRIASGSANVTFNGTINQAAAARAVWISGKTGGTIDITGKVTGNTGAADAITLANNTNTTINFSGGLDLTTTTGTAFAATGQGTVNVANGVVSNTLTSSGGSALSLNSITVGGTGMTFGNVNSNSGIDITNVSGGTIRFAAGSSVNVTNPTASAGIRINSTSATIDFAGDVTVTGAALDGVAIVNNSGDISFAKLDIAISGLNSGLALSGTIGAKVDVADLDVTFQAAGIGSALSFFGATINANVSITDFDANATGGAVGTGTGVDLTGTTGTGMIRVGDTDPNGAGATIGSGLSEGFRVGASTNIDFIFGDGEETIDTGSQVLASTFITGTLPTNGSYNFVDVGTITGDVSNLGTPSVYFVDQAQSASGDGSSVANAGSILNAETSTADVIVLVDTDIDGTQDRIATFQPLTLDDGQILLSFASGDGPINVADLGFAGAAAPASFQFASNAGLGTVIATPTGIDTVRPILDSASTAVRIRGGAGIQGLFAEGGVSSSNQAIEDTTELPGAVFLVDVDLRSGGNAFRMLNVSNDRTLSVNGLTARTTSISAPIVIDAQVATLTIQRFENVTAEGPGFGIAINAAGGTGSVVFDADPNTPGNQQVAGGTLDITGGSTSSVVSGLVITEASGSIRFDKTTVDGSTRGISISGLSAGDVIDFGDTTVTGNTQIGIGLQSNNAAATVAFDDLNVTGSGIALFASDGGILDIDMPTSTLTSSGNSAAQISNTTLQRGGVSGITFASLTATPGPNTGLLFSGLSDNITVTGATSITGTGTGAEAIRLTGTIGGDIDLGDVDIVLDNPTSMGLNAGGATINAAVSADDFDITATGDLPGTVGVNLAGVTGTGSITLGTSTDPGTGPSSSIAGGIAIGVSLDATTSIDFVFGDGEGGTDTGSFIGATTQIFSNPGPAGGSYNFDDVDFTTGGTRTPINEFPLSGGALFFVDSDGATGGGDGSGSDVNNPATIAAADALTGAVTIVLIDNGNAIVDSDGFTLADGQNLDGFGNANSFMVGQEIPVFFSGVPAAGTSTITDPTGNGAATLQRAGDVLTVSGDNSVENIIINVSGGLGDAIKFAGVTSGETVNLGGPDGALTLTASGDSDDGIDSIGLTAGQLNIRDVEADGLGFGLYISSDTRDNAVDVDRLIIRNPVFRGILINTFGAADTAASQSLATDAGDILQITGSQATSIEVRGITAGTIAIGNANPDVGAGTSITSPNGVGFDVAGGAADITYNGTLTQTGAASAVSVQSMTGGSVRFNGMVTADTSTANAILIDTNAPTNTVTFAGGLDITTTTGSGISGNSSTLNILNGTATNQITTGNGVAVNLNEMTVDITLSNVMSTRTDAGNGINLTNLSGSFTLNDGTFSSVVSTSRHSAIQITQNDPTATRTLTVAIDGIEVTQDASGGSGSDEYGVRVLVGDQSSHAVTGEDDQVIISVTNSSFATEDQALDFINLGAGLTVTDLSNITLLDDPNATGRAEFLYNNGVFFSQVTFDADPSTIALDPVSGGTFLAGTSTNRVSRGLTFFQNFAGGAASGISNQGTLVFDSYTIFSEDIGLNAQRDQSAMTLQINAGAIDASSVAISDLVADITLSSLTIRPSIIAFAVNGVRLEGTSGSFTVTGATTLTTPDRVTPTGPGFAIRTRQTAFLADNSSVDIALNTLVVGTDTSSVASPSVLDPTTGGASVGINLQNTSGSFSISGATTITDVVEDAIILDGNSGDIAFNQVIINRPQAPDLLSGIVPTPALPTDNAAIRIRGTNTGTISFADVDIDLEGARSTVTGIDLADAVINADVSITDLDIVGTGATRTVGIDLSNTTGSAAVTFGDTANVAMASASIGATGNAPDVGVLFSAGTNVAFTFGDGEGSTDTGSIIGATVQISANPSPAGGTYNFQDVDFTSGGTRTPNNDFPVSGGNLIFVSAGGTATIANNDVNNPSSVSTADAVTTSGVTFVLINDGNAIVDTDEFSLSDGQNLDGFGNGNEFTTGQVIPVFFSGVPATGTAITDPFGSDGNAATGGAAVLTSSGGSGGAIVRVAGNNTLSNVIIEDQTGRSGVSLSGATGAVTLGSADGPLIVRGAAGAPSGSSGGIAVDTTGAAITITDLEVRDFAGNSAVSISTFTAGGSLDVDRLLLSGNESGILFNGNVGTLNIADEPGDVLTISGNQVGIFVNPTAAGTVTFGAGTTVTGSTVAGIVIAGGSLNVTYQGSLTHAGTGGAVDVSTGHTGTLTFDTGSTVNVTGGTGLQFGNSFGAANGTYNFNGTTTLNGGDAGIDITNGSTGTFTFGANTSITSPTGIAFNVNGGAPTVTMNGAITQNNISSAVRVSGMSGGAVTFNGLITANTTTNGAVALVSNTGATLNFNGGLDLTTNSGVAFSAILGGTINVANGSVSNTATSSVGAVVQLAEVTIGSTGITFSSLSSTNTSPNGLTLDNVSGGTFQVTGLTDLQNTSSSGGSIRFSGTNSATFIFEDVNLTQTNAGANTPSALQIAGAFTGSLTIRDFDATFADGTGSVGIDLSTATGGGTVTIGDTSAPFADADPLVSPSATITGADIGVQFSATTDLAFTFGDGEEVTDVGSSISATTAIGGTLPPAGQGTYNFLDVTFPNGTGLAGAPRIFFVDQAQSGSNGGTSVADAGSAFNAAAAANIDVVVLVDTDIDGTQDQISITDTFVLDANQFLISYAAGDTPIDLVDLGFTGGSVPNNFSFAASAGIGSTIAVPTGLDTVRPILFSSTDDVVEVNGTSGVANVFIRSTGAANTGISDTTSIFDVLPGTVTFRNLDVQTGGQAFILNPLATRSYDFDTITAQSTFSNTIDVRSSSATRAITITRFNDITVTGSGTNANGIVFAPSSSGSITFDAGTSTSGLQQVTGGTLNISGAGGPRLEATNVRGSIRFDRTQISNTAAGSAAGGIELSTLSGQFDFGDTNIEFRGGVGVQASLRDASSTLAFDDLTIIQTGGGFGARGLDVFGNGTLDIDSSTSTVTTVSGDAIFFFSIGLETNGTSGITFNNVTSVGANGSGILLGGISDDIHFTGTTTITNPGNVGSGVAAVSVESRLSSTVTFDDLDIALQRANTRGISLADAILSGSFIATDFDLTSTSATNTVAVDLTNTIDFGTVTLGDTVSPAASSASATIAGAGGNAAGPGIGIRMSSTTNVTFTFGDGELISDIASSITASDVFVFTGGIPAGGTYNFEDVSFTGDTSDLAGGISVFFASDGGGGGGTSFTDPGTIAQANAANVDAVVIFGDDGNNIRDTISLGSNIFDLNDGQVLVSFIRNQVTDLANFGLSGGGPGNNFVFNPASVPAGGTIIDATGAPIDGVHPALTGTGDAVVDLNNVSGAIVSVQAEGTGLNTIRYLGLGTGKTLRLENVLAESTGGVAINIDPFDSTTSGLEITGFGNRAVGTGGRALRIADGVIGAAGLGFTTVTTTGSTTGPAVTLTEVLGSGTLGIASVNLNASGSADTLVINRSTAAITISAGTINNSGSGTTVEIGDGTNTAGGNAISIGANLSTTGTGLAVLIDNRTGGILDFTGRLIDTAATGGQINISGANSGSIRFTGGNAVLTNQVGSSVGNAVDISGSGNATFVFENFDITSSGLNGFAVSGSLTGSLTLTDVDVFNTGGIGFNIDAVTDALSVQGTGNSVTASSSGRGVRLRDITLGGALVFDFVSATASSSFGIDVSNLAGVGQTLTFSTVILNTSSTGSGGGIRFRNSVPKINVNAGSITHRSSGVGIEIGETLTPDSGGANDITINASINSSTATGLAVSVLNRAGGTLTFAGNLLDDAAAGGGIAISETNAGVITFTGSSNTVSTLNQLRAVDIQGSGTVDISLANLTINAARTSGAVNGLNVIGSFSAGASLSLNNVIANADGGGAIAINLDTSSPLELSATGTLEANGTNGARALRIGGINLAAGGVTFTSVTTTGTGPASSDAVTLSDITGGDLTIASIGVTASGTGGGVEIYRNTSNININAGVIGRSGSGTALQIGLRDAITTNPIGLSGGGNDITIAADIGSRGATGLAVDIFERTGGTVTISGALIDDAAAGGGIAISGANAGAITFSGGSSANPNLILTDGNGISISGSGNAAFTFQNFDVTNTSLNGLAVSGALIGSLSLTDIDVFNSAGIGFNIDPSTSAFNVSGTQNSVAATAGGRGVRLQDITLGGPLTFDRVTTADVTSFFGIDLSRVNGSETLRFTSIDLNSTGAGGGIRIRSSAANITVSGGVVDHEGNNPGVQIGETGTAGSGGSNTITINATVDSSDAMGLAADIQERTGGTLTFSGRLLDSAGGTGTGGGIEIDGANAGTIRFTGGSSSNPNRILTDGNGIDISGSGNAAFTFQNFDITNTSLNGVAVSGGLAGSLTLTDIDVFNSAGIGFNIDTSSSALSVSGSQNSVTTSGSARYIRFRDFTVGGPLVFDTIGNADPTNDAVGAFFGIDISNLAGAGQSVTFTNVALNTDSGGGGIRIRSSAPTINVNGGSITHQGSGAGVQIGEDGVVGSGGSNSITIAASINSSDGTGLAVDIQERTGGNLAFTGRLLDNAGGGGGIDIAGSNAGNISFTGGSSAAKNQIQTPFDAIEIDGSGSAAFTFRDFDIATTAGNGVFISGAVTGSVFFTNIDVANSTGIGFNIDPTTTAFDVRGVGNSVTASNGGRGLRLQDIDINGALTFDSVVAPDVTSGFGILMNRITGTGQTITITSATLGSTGGGGGVSISDTVPNVLINGGTITNTGGGSAVAIGSAATNQSGGSNTIEIAANINSTGATGLAVDIDERVSGSVVFSGNFLDNNATGGGISIENINNGSTATITFSGTSKVINTAITDAVDISNSTANASVSFTNGGLDIDTTAGTGFRAVGGGIVTVTGANNTVLVTSSGQAVEIKDTTIGPGNVTFQAISQIGGSTAIELTNTGSSGDFDVTGTGTTNSSGGVLNGTTGPSVLLTNVNGVSFANLRIANPGDIGIRGTTVVDFDLSNVNIVSPGNATGEHGIFITNLLGTASAGTDSTWNDLAISQASGDAIRIENSTATSAGNLSNPDLLTINGATIQRSANSGVQFIASSGGTANMSLVVTGSQFVNNAAAGIATNADAGDVQFRLTGSQIIEGAGGQMNKALSGGTTNNGDLYFTILGNTLSAFENTPGVGPAVIAYANIGTGTVQGQIGGNGSGEGNTISYADNNTNVAGIELRNNGNGGSMTVEILNNQITVVDGFGIIAALQGSNGASTANFQIQGNTIEVSSTDGAANTAIDLVNTSASSGLLCVDVSGNTLTTNGLFPPQGDILLSNSGTGTFQVVQSTTNTAVGGSADFSPNTEQVEKDIQLAQLDSVNVQVFINPLTNFGNYTAVGACTSPTNLP